MAKATLKDGTVIQDEDPTAPNYVSSVANSAAFDLGDPSTPGSSATPPGSVSPGYDPQAVAAAQAKADAEARAKADALAVAQANIEAARRREAPFQYGGWAGGAHEAASRYKVEGDKASTREGVKIDFTNANGARDLNLASRGNQSGMAGLMAARARGETPSIAGMMADRQMRQAAAEQSSAAASARGPAALALAQQGAAGNTAAMQSNISNAAQINAANERLQAEQAAFSAYTGMRGGDQGLQGQDAGQAVSQAQLEAEQRRLNDAMKLGMTGFETGVQKTQLDAQGNKVGIESGVTTANANRSSAESMHGDDRTDKYIIGGAGAAAGIGGAIIASNLLGGGGKAAPGTAGVAGGEGGGTAPGPLPQGDGYYNEGGTWVGGGGGSTGDDLSDERTKVRSPMASRMLSDDHTKLAAAWDAGNKAAVDSARTLAAASPEELKRVAGNKTHPASAVAAAVRDAKAGAYDEGDTGGTDRAHAQSSEAKAAKRDAEAEWFRQNNVSPPPAPGSPIERPAAWGPAPAPTMPQPAAEASPSWWNGSPMAGRMRAMVSDEKTKNVGTLGPQVPHHDMAEFARSMRGVPYEYKPEYAEREGQAPGEVNVGPVAQEMEKSKVGRTIVKPDPAGSGMRTLDQPKMVKGLGAVVADQQDQLDEMRSMMARRMGGRR